MQSFADQIADALGREQSPDINLEVIGTAELPSCYRVTDLAVASIGAAATELAALKNARQVLINRRLASLWFDMTLRPVGWQLPSVWDDIAGVYPTADGWVRLHTNAPHHRQAALDVLNVAPERERLSETCVEWDKAALETAVVEAGGAAAALYSTAQWQRHPQGKAVAQEPLIAWHQGGETRAPATLNDIKVLDLTRVLAGPVATRFLAGFGAQVLRIDPPSWNEPGVVPEVTLGKTCAGLDLTRKEDREIFSALLEQADVLIHGYRPGALEGLGFGEEERRMRAPHLIDISLCAYGWTGPWAARRGFDSLVQMSCGIAAEGMVRKSSASPYPLPVQALDHATGYLMAAAALRALRIRNAEGHAMGAKLSLARTAELLMSPGAHPFRGQDIEETPEDYGVDQEMTYWGPARRIAFPVTLDQMAPNWARAAGPLRLSSPAWP